jgi:hypothetical protein
MATTTVRQVPAPAREDSPYPDTVPPSCGCTGREAGARRALGAGGRQERGEHWVRAGGRSEESIGCEREAGARRALGAGGRQERGGQWARGGRQERGGQGARGGRQERGARRARGTGREAGAPGGGRGHARRGGGGYTILWKRVPASALPGHLNCPGRAACAPVKVVA